MFSRDFGRKTFVVMLAVLFGFCGSAGAATLLSDDFQANTAGTLPTDVDTALHPVAPTGITYYIMGDSSGTSLQVLNNVNPSDLTTDPPTSGSNKYVNFDTTATEQPTLWAYGWDPDVTLNKNVKLEFDVWQPYYDPETYGARYTAVTTFRDWSETAWWTHGKAWTLYFKSDGTIDSYDGASQTSTGETFTTDAWQHVVIEADMEAQTYTLSVEGGDPVSLGWGAGSSADTYSVSQLYFQMSETGGTSAIDNLGFDVVPEPSTAMLLVVGLVGLLAYAWRKRK